MVFYRFRYSCLKHDEFTKNGFTEPMMNLTFNRFIIIVIKFVCVCMKCI